MAAAVFLEEVARIELGLCEALRLHELLLGRAMPDAHCVGLPVQRLRQSPHDRHTAIVENRSPCGGSTCTSPSSPSNCP
eukprot:429808-Pleurochrysis_carterae.AAC.1